jgi:hypothetical protein
MFGKKDVTEALIEEYLNRFGWPKHERVPEMEKYGMVLTGWGNPASGEAWMLAIDPVAEKNELSFVVPQIASAPRDATPEARIHELTFLISAIDAKITFGKFGYDPSGGNVLFQHVLPTDGAEISYEQFAHVLTQLAMIVENLAPKIRGTIEGTTTAAAVIASM